MAAPRVLIREDILKDIHRKYKDGVKYKTLLRNYNLNISGPTLKKLIDLYDKLDTYSNLETRSKTEEDILNFLRSSLFPPWLINPVDYQDTKKWLYKGNFPFGVWELKT